MSSYPDKDLRPTLIKLHMSKPDQRAHISYCCRQIAKDFVRDKFNLEGDQCQTWLLPAFVQGRRYQGGGGDRPQDFSCNRSKIYSMKWHFITFCPPTFTDLPIVHLYITASFWLLNFSFGG